MYLYIYDTAISRTSAYQTALAKIEARLVELGIHGLTERFTPLKSLEHIVKDGRRRGIKTVIVVGGDKLMTQFLNLIPDFPEISVGFIPLAENSRLAQLFGLPLREKACDVLSARITRRMDVGKVNGHFFFLSLESSDQNVNIAFDNHYRLSLTSASGRVSICNIGNIFQNKPLSASFIRNPADGVLEVLIEEKMHHGFGSWFKGQRRFNTVVPTKKCTVRSSDTKACWTADGFTTMKTPLDIEIVPQAIKIIVGKNRLFD